MVKAWLAAQEVLVPLLGNDLEEVVHTHMPRSASSIIWYQPSDSDILQLGS